jgi:hypothetical protein
VAENTLSVPRLLTDLVERRVWPADGDQARAFEWAYPSPDDDVQERERLIERYGLPRVPVERIRLIHPTECKLYLFPPPFLPSTQRTMANWDLPGPWKDFFAPQEIDRDQIIEVGDFGHGSDQPIILDYQNDPQEPNVRRLACKVIQSGPEGRRRVWDNHWIEIASSFDEFARLLGLI